MDYKNTNINGKRDSYGGYYNVWINFTRYNCWILYTKICRELVSVNSIGEYLWTFTSFVVISSVLVSDSNSTTSIGNLKSQRKEKGIVAFSMLLFFLTTPTIM